MSDPVPFSVKALAAKSIARAKGTDTADYLMTDSARDQSRGVSNSTCFPNRKPEKSHLTVLYCKKMVVHAHKCLVPIFTFFFKYNFTLPAHFNISELCGTT